VLLVALALLGGCGDDSGDSVGRAKTRPVELFATPPSGYRYAEPDAATRKQVRGAILKEAPFAGNDIAIRQVLPKRGKEPVAIAIAIDAQNSGEPGDAVKGFSESAEEQGSKATPITVAGTDAAIARIKGVQAALAGKNGYVVEAIASEEATVKLVLARLIFAASEAER
jgi:hypothetical protein